MAKIFEEIYKSIVKKGLDNLVDATPQTTSTESNKVENKLKSGPISQTSINPVLNRNQKSLLDPINYVKNNLDTLKKTADIIGMASKQMNKAREEVGLKSPAHEITEPINNAVTGVLNKLAEDNKSLNKVQQEHLDASSSAYLDTNDIIQKIKNDRTYYSNLFDNDGNLKDYSSEIIRLQEVASNQFGSEDRKAAKQQLDLYKQYQSEQKKLVYASQYQELVNSGADNDTLNKFKKAVVQDNYNEAERVLANFGSTVQSFVGSQLNALNALTATVNKLTGGEPTMSDYPSHIIQEAEDLQSIIMSNANGAEQVAYKVYNGMAPFLYSLLLGGMTSQSFLGNQAAAQALTNRALLISDASVLGQKMKENMAKGYDFNTSVLNASLHAMLSHITESIGGESIANILTGDIGVHLLDNYLNYTSRALANPFISEMIEEGTEASIEPIIDSLTLNTGLTVEEYINQVFSKDTLEQMLIGGLGGLVMGAGSTFKTIYEFDSGVKKLADTIDINDSKDYSSAKEANEFFKTLIQETQDKLASGQVAEDRINETTNQLFVMKELQKSYATKISEYETMNPYANAFISPEDTTSKLSGDAQQEVMKAAAPTLKQNIDDIVNAKQKFYEADQELNEVLQQKLTSEGVNISVADYNALSEDAKEQVNLTAKYSSRLKHKVIFANVVGKNGESLPGLYDPRTKSIIVNPNYKSGALFAYVHEITHNSENSVFYKLLKKLVKDYLGDDFDKYVEYFKENYSDITQLSNEEAEAEVVSTTTQSLLSNEEFLDKLVRYNTSLAYEMYEEIKYINSETNTIQDIEQNFMRAIKTSNDTETELISIFDPKSKTREIKVESFQNNVNKIENEKLTKSSILSDAYESMINTFGDKNIGFIESTGEKIRVSGENIKHGLLKLNKQKGKINAFVTENIGPLLKNAHYVNDIISSENHPNGQRVYISAIADEEGFLYPTRIIVDKNTSVVSETEVINRLYAINAKKVVGQSPLGYGYESQPSTTSTLSVSDLFDYVKDVDIFQEIMPISSGMERVDSEIGRKLKYSKGVTLEDLGRTKDLIAAHNLSEDKLLASINLGGFVMPSIAVTKDTVSHDGFGPITLLFDKNTIDPSNKLNKVYSQDAWTPIFPQIETEIIRSEADKVRNHLYDLSRKVDQNYAGTIRNFTNKYFNSVAPTDYFEAKPRRIIGLDEIQTAIIPNNSSDYLKETLRNDGINYIEYDPNIEGDRQQKIYAQDNLKFSKGITLEELKANTKTSSEQKILKSFFKEKFGANLRRTSLGIDSLLNLYTYEVINNGEVSESTYNRLKEAVWESSKVRRGNNAYDPSELRRYLKDNPILVTQLEYRDSDTINNFGSIGFSKNGNSFDKVMMEFDSLYPGLIDTENIKTATEFVDAVSNVIDTLESQKNGYFVPDLENMTSEQELREDFDEKFDGAMKIYEEEIIKKNVVDNVEKNADEIWRDNTQSVLDKVNPSLDEELTVENIDSILKHKDINPRTLDSIEKTKDIMIENADKWIKGYDTLREEFPLYSKETFSNALYEILIYGDIKPETYDKMANALSSEYDYEDIVIPDFEKDINKFINETIVTFTNEAKYKAGEINLEPIKKAMTLNEAYNGQTIDDDTKRFVNNSRLNETTSKFKKQIKEGWQDTVNELLEFNKQIKEKNGKDISSRVSRYKTIDQNIDALATGNVELRNKLKQQIRYDLLDEAAKVKYDILSYANDLVNQITDLGITEGGKENIALQYILEKHTNVVRSDLDLGENATQETIDEFYRNPYEAYTEEDLKNEFDYKMSNGKYAWENILSAAKLIKESYDDIYSEIFDSQILANGDVEGNMDLKLAEAKTQVEQAYKVMENIKAEIKMNGSKESTQAAYEIAKAKFNRLVNQYNALVTRDERGDSTRRQLTPYRENFSHHIVKRSVKSDIESIKDAGLMTPTQLAGISEQTKPNTMWASFSAAQDSLDYEPNALASYTEYMKEAANVVSYNPVILSLRNLTSDIQATAQNRELNKLAEYLTDYTNMLSGKRLGIDREVQKFVGDKGMKIISTLNKYAKAAALTGNIRSALVQFANIPSGLANLSIDVSPKELAIDIAYGIKDWINKDSGKHDLIKLSPFMNNRYFDFDTGKNGVMNSLDDFAKTMLQVGDKIGAETIWYSALNQGMRLGVPNAVKYADDITRKSIAGRTKEDMAVAMNSQVLNLLFPFQVENNNLYQNLKQYMRDGKAGAIITYGVSAYIFNAIIKAIMNSDDEILPEFVTPIVDEVTKGLKGEQGLDDTVQNALFGEIGEMISLMPVGSTLLNLTLNNDKANELFGDYNPSRYGTTNIGLSGIGNVISSLDNDNNRIAFADALSDLIAGYVKGGKQFIRTTEGLQSMGGLPKLDAEGNVVMTPVNYTKSGRIAYVNDQSNIPDWIRASLFGKYSTDPAREYIDSGFKTMTDKEQRIFELLNDSGTGTKEAYNTATEHTDLVNQSKEDETIDSSLRNKLIENGTYSDYMSTLTESYEKYLEDFDYENETPKTFKQFASSYGISSDDLKQDTYQGFYELYDLSEEQQKAFSEAMDIENSVNALGKTISNSGATQRRLIYEQQGIYDDILEFIEENNLDYSDFGLTKTVVGYNSSQINTMLEKIGMESNYTTDDKTSPSEPKNTYTSSGKSSSKSRLSTKQKSLLKMYLSIINSNYSNFQKIMNSMTSVQEAKSNIEKILKNIKG